ncbi:uncharacterized protein LOC126371508 [Pectinophora gossypiella]|nr:uncharacterized protein LOC126371508 [Pectinophora gossypiella]
MGVSARIFGLLLLISAAIAIPTGEPKKAFTRDFAEDLMAEPSEFIQEAIAAPKRQAVLEQDPASDGDHSVELEGGSQTFFPSFANLFEPRQNNFRLGFGNQEAAYSQRPNCYRSLFNYPVFNGFRGLEGFGKNENQQSAPLVDASASVLGSGNFGIIRGGTFSGQNDEDEYDAFNSFYNNGHGRPSHSVGYIANPRPNYNQDQFANFRDFADINTPSNSAYSHYVVVYANKNATIDEVGEESRKVVSKPKNIIETLESLDEKKPVSKMSKSKAKLEQTKQKMRNKKEQWKKANSKYMSIKPESEEPLLALS